MLTKENNKKEKCRSQPKLCLNSISKTCFGSKSMTFSSGQ